MKCIYNIYLNEIKRILVRIITYIISFEIYMVI